MLSNFSLLDIPAFYTRNLPEGFFSTSAVAQTEVGNSFSSNKLLSQEEIGPKPFDIHVQTTPKSVRFAPYRKPPSNPTVQQTSVVQLFPSKATDQPSSTPAGGARSRHTTPVFSGKGSFDSEEEEGSQDGIEEEEEDGEPRKRIPKPEGEAGRPGRGGYNLEKILGWKKKEYTGLKALVKNLIDEHLDPSKSFVSQQAVSLEVVHRLATEKFPQTRRYEDGWLITDLIRQQLKYSSGRARSVQSKSDAEIGKRLRLSHTK